ncbi:MAG: hypothetical protein U0599_03870 [Vicinamibacteria bacterium]
MLEDSWSVGYLGGGALYLFCALQQLGGYRGFAVELGRQLSRGGPTS